MMSFRDATEMLNESYGWNWESRVSLYHGFTSARVVCLFFPRALKSRLNPHLPQGVLVLPGVRLQYILKVIVRFNCNFILSWGFGNFGLLLSSSYPCGSRDGFVQTRHLLLETCNDVGDPAETGLF